MKKSDWALIIIIVAVVAVASWAMIGNLLPAPSDEVVKTAPSITADIEAPENNVILYDSDRPSWCPIDTSAGTTTEESSGTNEEGTSNPDEATDESSTAANSSETSVDKQYINTIFNSCAINSSFTTTTE